MSFVYIVKVKCWKMLFFLLVVQLAFSGFPGFRVDARVFGCGGFIKSHADLDLTQIEVHLLTKSGALKDKTEVLSNGYYFLPIYDKGDYVLRVIPQAGWSFEPESVQIAFDGVSDPCSLEQDINFVFTGFGITGKVLVKSNKEPAGGVKVDLLSDKGEVLRKTNTDSAGVFSFTPLLPGSYSVKASHPRWHFAKAEHRVTVSQGNTILPEDVLLVSGFDIQGSVTNQGQASLGLLIYPRKGQKSEIKCEEKSLPAGVHKHSDYEKTPLCLARTNSAGKYTFSAVSPGKYLIIPHLDDAKTKFQISPSQIEVSVQKDTLEVAESFEITGFSVSGRVLTKTNGIGIANAKIILNGQKATETDKSGSYTLKDIKIGSYTIRVEAPDVEFEEQIVRISLPDPKIPDITVSAFKVCGQVVSDRAHRVTLSKQGSTVHREVTSKPPSGEWCTFLPAGTYSVQVAISETDRSEGIQFFPLSQSVEIDSSPVGGLVFSQLRATVRGKVQCLPETSAKDIVVELTPTEGDQFGQTTTATKEDGSYIFTNVLPGTYSVSVSKPQFCWKLATVKIVVKTVEEAVPTFVQTGFSVTFVSSHATEILYKRRGDSNEKQERTPLQPGANSFCLPKAGVYDLTFAGCHTYDSSAPSSFRTDNLQPITLNAVKHRIGARILSEETTTFRFRVESNEGQSLGEKETRKETEKIDGRFAYRAEFDLAPGERIKLTPRSELMLFKPPSADLIGTADCTDVGLAFTAVKGLVIQGRTEPRIAEAKVTLSFPNNADLSPIVTTTDTKGEFRFPPVDAALKHALSAKKESYTFSEFDAAQKIFKGHKLCEVVATVKDDAGKKLAGVLLSLSGGEGYRKNLVTGDDGAIKFHSLGPGQYYLRPMMKEYKFEPATKMIEVKEGATVDVELRGTRVAFSAFGVVTSLNGDPFKDITVQAQASAACENHLEEANSEVNGQFRIRGLRPGCTYAVSVKTDTTSNVDRSIPASKEVKISQEDIRDLNFIAMSPLAFIDVTVRVYASENDHYKTLKIALLRKDSETPVHSQRIEPPLQPKSKTNPGSMVFFPRIPFDSKTYVIELSTSLSEKAYRYTQPSVEFLANQSNHFFELHFEPKLLSHDAELLAQNSLPALILIALVSFAFFKQELALDLLNKFWSWLSATVGNLAARARKSETPRDLTVNEDEIDALAREINAKKKNRFKRRE